MKLFVTTSAVLVFLVFSREAEFVETTRWRHKRQLVIIRWNKPQNHDHVRKKENMIPTSVRIVVVQRRNLLVSCVADIGVKYRFF